MHQNEKTPLIVGCLLFGILGYIFEVIYAIEEDGVLNEGLNSTFYQITSYSVKTVIRPLQIYWDAIWPDQLMNGIFAVPIIILFWSIFGFCIGFFLWFIWSTAQKTLK